MAEDTPLVKMTIENPLVELTISTRHPEKWELIDHDENKHWAIRNGVWRQITEWPAVYVEDVDEDSDGG